MNLGKWIKKMFLASFVVSGTIFFDSIIGLLISRFYIEAPRSEILLFLAIMAILIILLLLISIGGIYLLSTIWKSED